MARRSAQGSQYQCRPQRAGSAWLLPDVEHSAVGNGETAIAERARLPDRGPREDDARRLEPPRCLLAFFSERVAALYVDGELQPTPATTCSA